MTAIYFRFIHNKKAMRKKIKASAGGFF